MLTRCTYVLIFSMLVIGCQVKEKEPDELIANHNPATNVFSVSSPPNGTYTPGNVLNFKLSFPYLITVTGVPRLQFTIGSTTRYANYVSGNGTKLLTFQYGVLSNDDDPDGITLNALQLNGGTLTFPSSSGFTDCAISTVTTRNYPNLIIDDGLLLSETVCGTIDSSRCSSFKTGDAISNLPLNGSVYIAFRTPNVVGDYELLGPGIGLIDQGTGFAFATPDAFAELLMSGSSSGTIHPWNMLIDSVEVVKILASTPIDLNGIALDSNVYEVILTAPDLTAEEESQIEEMLELFYK